MMIRILCLVFCTAMTNMIWSQDLHVGSGGSFFISPDAFTYVTNDINVVGDLIVTSDTSTQKSGSLIVKGTATGEITYERNIPDANWHLVSAPVTSQPIGAFATNTENAVKTQALLYAIGKYNNANIKDARWEHYTAATASGINFVNGKGYSTSRTAAGNFTFKGGMATADVSVTIPENSITPFVASVSEITGSHVWSVVGNPYPSFLPANNTANGTSNVLLNNSTILDQYKQYINVWNGSTYEAINHSSPAYYIAPGQAFMVDAVGNNQSFVFSEDTQAPQLGATAVFYRATTTPEIIVYLSNGTETKKTTLRYFNTSTNGLDVGYDAGTFDTSFPFAIDTHLVSDSPGMDFTIQCLPDTNYEDTIVPLSIKAAANETITFSTEVAGLPDGLEVYLEDKEARTITNISTGNHQVVLGESLDGIGRFYLHNSVNGILSTEDLASTLNIYKTSNNNLRITSLQEGPATVKIFSVLGKEVTSSSFQMKTVNDIAIPNHLAKGIYIVQLITNEVKQSRKIIIE